MSEGTEHHLEHAEHAQHAAHDPFDRRVAMTMAIVAAVLACIAMLSHRTHTETLRRQTQADINHTKASDTWSYYQAKKNRQYMEENDAELLQALAREPKQGETAELIRTWKEKAKEYKKDSDRLEDEAKELVKEAQKLEKESDHNHHRATRYDLGQLSVELALVLCSLAVLTKLRGFWLVGIAFGVIGIVVALSGFLEVGLH